MKHFTHEPVPNAAAGKDGDESRSTRFSVFHAPDLTVSVIKALALFLLKLSVCHHLDSFTQPWRTWSRRAASVRLTGRFSACCLGSKRSVGSLRGSTRRHRIPCMCISRMPSRRWDKEIPAACRGMRRRDLQRRMKRRRRRRTATEEEMRLLTPLPSTLWFKALTATAIRLPSPRLTSIATTPARPARPPLLPPVILHLRLRLPPNAT